MKKILIIGGSGFLGKNLCHYLIHKNYEVFCFDLEEPTKVDKLNFIQGDFFNDKDLEKVIIGMDCVIHAVSTINPGNSNVTYMRGYRNDFLQTIKLCNMLLNRKTKLIFLSSGGTVYGNHLEQPIDESVLPHPINHYGNIKLSIENAMRTFNYQMNTNFIIARISNPYGRGQDFHKGVGFIDAAIRNTINGLPIEIWGDGENVRDYIYVDDVCEMLACLIEYSGKEDTFNLSSGIGTSQNEVIQIIQRMGLCPKVVYKEKRSVDVRTIILNNDKIQGIFGKKMIDLEDGIKRYYHYLKEEKNEDGRCD